MALMLCMQDPVNLLSKDEKIIEDFNNEMKKINEQVVEFLYLHYVTNKTNTPYWSDLVKNYKMPESLKNKLELFSHRAPYYRDFSESVFSLESWLAVMAGNDILNLDTVNSSYSASSLDQVIANKLLELDWNQKQTLNASPTHKEFIRLILERT